MAAVEVWRTTAGYLAKEQYREVVTTNDFRAKQLVYESCLRKNKIMHPDLSQRRWPWRVLCTPADAGGVCSVFSPMLW